MKVLFLGYDNSPLLSYLKEKEQEVLQTVNKIDLFYIRKEKPDFIVSYLYRHILSQDILEHFPNRAINLHCSFLPWNRGADANLWSFIDRTPKGVTIHNIDAGIDTGDIIVQKEITFTGQETLKTSYDKLHGEIQNLFITWWPKIKDGSVTPTKQTSRGTFHMVKDKEALNITLSEGWDTPISEVIRQTQTKP